MKPIEVIKQAEGMRLENEDGVVEELKLLPPLSEKEFEEASGRDSLPNSGRSARAPFVLQGG